MTATQTGSDAGNYIVALAPKTAAITPRAITANVTVSGKTYDGDRAAGTLVRFTNAVDGEVLTLDGMSFGFADKNVGDRKAVTMTGTLSGTKAGNYTLTLPTDLVASIVARVVSVNPTVASKTYDRTRAATGTTGEIGNVVTGDNLRLEDVVFSFADEDAGAGKAVTMTGRLTGADAGNYSLTLPTGLVADILRKAVTATVRADGKTYDGTTAATGRIVGLDGVVDGDAVTATDGSFRFADANAGAGKTVAIDGVALGGADAGNYTLTIPALVRADIARRLVVRGNDTRKVEGQPDPALGYTLASASLVAGDAFSGGLTRAVGETPGSYDILQGTLALSPNYQLDYQRGTLVIEAGAPVVEGEKPQATASDLGQTVELGGRVQSLTIDEEPLLWTSPINCTRTEEGEKCR
jgi:hypothetical protein